MEPIQVSFTFTEDAYKKVSHHSVNQMLKRQKRLGYILVGILVITTTTALITGRWQMLLSFLLPVAVFVPVWRWTMNRMFKKVFAQQKNLHHPINYTFSDDHIASQSFSGESSLNWEAFEKAEEMPDFFLLYQNATIVNPILKSGFQNEADMAEFRGLLARKGLVGK
jgi:hypothetical protein